MLHCARITTRPLMRTAIARPFVAISQLRKPAQPLRWITWSTIPTSVKACTVKAADFTNVEEAIVSKLSLVQRIRGSCDRLHTKACVILLTGVNPDSGSLTTATEQSTRDISGSDVVAEAASYFGDGKWIESIRASRPIQFTVHSLEWLHAALGLGWAPTFVIAAVITRVCILPLVFYQARVVHEIARLLPHFTYIKQLGAQSHKSKGRIWFETTRLRWLLYRKYKCHPIRLLFPGLAQFGILASVAVSIRPLIASSPSIQTDGVLWLSDLTMPDPWFVLPIAVTALYYFQGRLTEHFSKVNSARKQRELEVVLRPHMSKSKPVAPIPAAVPAAGQNTRAGNTATLVPGSFMEIFNYYKGAFIIVVMPISFSLLPSGLAIFQLTGALWSVLQLTVMQSDVMKSFLGVNTEMRPIVKPVMSPADQKAQSDLKRLLNKPAPSSDMSDSDQKIRSDIDQLYSQTTGARLQKLGSVPAPVQFYEGDLKSPSSKKSSKSSKKL